MDRSSSMSNSLSQIFLGVTQNFDFWHHEHGHFSCPCQHADTVVHGGAGMSRHFSAATRVTRVSSMTQGIEDRYTVALNTRACTVFHFHSHHLTIQHSRQALPVAGGQVEINDVADAYDCADLFEFAIRHAPTL